MRYFVASLIVLLLILHQDYWAWTDARLWLGVMPRSLVWQLGISVAASGVWLLAAMFCWPTTVDDV